MLLRWVKNIVNHHKIYAVAALLLIILLSFFSRIPEIDGHLSGISLESSKYYQAGKKIADHFNIPDIIEVKVTPSVQDASVIWNSLGELENNLNVAFDKMEVNSIHHARRMISRTMDSTRTLDTILAKIADVPILQNLISVDRKSFLFISKVHSPEEFELRVFDSIVELPYKGIESLKCMSIFHAEQQIAQSLGNDLIKIITALVFSISMLILWLYRDLKALFYIGVIVSLSLIPLLFTFTIFNVPFNLITALAVPVVIILSLADAVHLITGYLNSEGTEWRNRVTRSMESYIIPSFLTSLTTAIAFGSFLLNSAESIRNFGFIIAICIMASFILTFTLSPFLLRILRVDKQLSAKSITGIINSLNKYRAASTYTFLTLSIVALFTIPKIKFQTDFDSFIPRNTPIESNRLELSKDFHSQLEISLLIERAESNTQAKSKDIERDVAAVTEEIEELEFVSSTRSIKDQIEFKKRFGPFGQFIIFPKKNNPYKNIHSKVYRIDVRVTDANRIHSVANKIDSVLNTYSDQYDYEIFSKALLIDELNKGVSASLFRSLIFSFVLILGCFLFITKSWKKTMISVIVNLTPLSLIMLIFYLGGYSINILTAITIVVCLGIIVDDTTHIIYRRQNSGQGIKELDFGIITTSLILFFGFLTFLLSSFQPSKDFGLIAALVFILTMIADLTMLPYLLDRFRLSQPSSPFKKTDNEHADQNNSRPGKINDR